MKSRKIYDAIIIGSGAAGGVAAHVLVNRGLDVLLLDIGPKWDPLTYYRTSHKWRYEMPYRGFGRPGLYDGLWKINEFTEHLYVNPLTDAYARAPGTDFHWTRIHAVGGRTITWGRVSLRFAAFDFKPKSLQDGFGEDWPVGYEDIAPYYDKAEQLMGVFGARDGLWSLPDGIYQPPPGLRCGEVALQRAGAKLSIPVVNVRMAVLTRRRAGEGRAPCHYCNGCGRGCETFSRFSTLEAIIPALLARRNFTLRTHAAAHRVLMDARTNKARGVAFIDTQNKQEYEVFAKTVVLGAGAMESTRILFNSKTREHPRGLANSSGALGHYLMDNFSAGDVYGVLPGLRGAPTTNDEGVSGGHAYVPRFVNRPGGETSDFLRGWQFQTSAGTSSGLIGSKEVPGFGRSFKREIRNRYTAIVGVRGSGETLPRFESRCEIDPDGLKDRYGIPQLRFNATWGDNERKMAQAMYGHAEELLRTAGAEILPYSVPPLPPPGDATHEVGTARMGADAKASVLNAWNQTHEVSNLFVVDGAGFVSCPEKNPTLTIAALAWRACDYLVEELKRGRL